MVLFVIIVAGGWGAWIKTLGGRVKTLGAEVADLNNELATLTTYFEEARSFQTRLEAVLNLTERLRKEITSQGWAPALRSVRESAGPEIELQNVRGSGRSVGATSCELLIEGVASGAAPRVAADRFRGALQQQLERKFQSAVTTRFDQLEDVAPETASQKAVFAITATVGKSGQEKPATPDGP